MRPADIRLMRPVEPLLRDGCVVFETSGHAPAMMFRDPVDLLVARSIDEVAPTLERMRDAHRAGFHLAGYVAYEAGSAFEPKLAPIAAAPTSPLVCFAVCRAPEAFRWTDLPEEMNVPILEPAWTRADYARRFEQVLDLIRAGDVYQVNLTMPLRGRWRGDPLAYYAALRRRQPARYGAVVKLGGPVLLSFSPELFFETDGRTIRMRPMKGTAPRGPTPGEDDRLAHRLATNPKDRAENLMIVDLMRNDLSRIAEVGSVRVTDLHTVERYPTLLQMTSGVEATLRPGVDFVDIFRATFPCGSVTGAPKIRAMQVIHALESEPRGGYCGAVGFVRPDGSARFNVAIRTAALAPDGGMAFHVGSGIVFDSDAGAEYDECLLKARFLRPGGTSA